MRKVIKGILLSAVVGMLLSACGGAASSASSKAHEHTYGEQWIFDDNNHWHEATCEHKDERSEEGEHQFVKKEVVEPTATTRGYTLYQCSVCGYSKETDYVAPVNPYTARIKSKDFKVINLSYEKQSSNDPRFFDEAKPLTNYIKQDTYKLYYLDEVNDVYYLPLATYVDLFKGDFKDGVVNTVKESAGVSLWTSSYNNSTYTLSIDSKNQTISVMGSIEEYFKPIPNGRNGLADQCKLDISYVDGHKEKVKTFSFKEYGFDIFDVNGTMCYPFALIGAELSKYVERKFINVSYYNYLVEYVASEQYMDFTYLDESNKEIRIYETMEKAYAEQYGVLDEHNHKIVKAPKALAEFNKKIIYYLFDKYYGLASTKGIKSMSSYFDNLADSSNFEDVDGIKRGSAYYHAIQGLNDLHSAYGYSPFMNEGANDDAIQDQSFYKDRTNLNALLVTLREQEIEKYNKAKGTDVTHKQVRYSDDGKYAYFSFDSFNTFTYFGEGEIPDNELFNDTYYQFLRNLNEIKAKGTVKRVFIDDTLNGGGYVYIMGKLLALLSKDNKSTMYLHDETDNSIQAINISVDSNNDGKYDAKDCYGNDFDFYIITSSYSFSCGNAFPFYADQNRLAKVVGVQSGGGECCIFNYVLPTGQSISYSSPYHIAQYNKEKDTCKGDEEGTYPWLGVNKSYSLYDVDALGAFVTLRQPF